MEVSRKLLAICLVSLLVAAASFWFPQNSVQAQADDPTPPEGPVKLVFIHHSTGENWLQDDYGNLGLALDANHYFVSDTNYGWGPGNIGDLTDIVDWPEWFGPERSEKALNRLFEESGQNSWWTRSLSDPGGENEIVLFKSCFPNSELSGRPNDPPTPGDYDYTVGSAKYIYTLLLDYFSTRPDKMFVVITAPPVSSSEYAANARAFNLWLVYDWLSGYPGANVFVFDFYNVLTGPDNHHRFRNGQVEHVFSSGMDTLYYPSDDDHPSQAGSQKATDEFVPLLNIYYHRWKSAQPYQPPSGEMPSAEQPEQQEPETEEMEEPASPPVSAQPLTGGLIANFEDGAAGWQSHEDGMGSRLTCREEGSAYSGDYALQMDFELVRDGYAGCGFSFETPQDWSASEGLSFYLHAHDPDIWFTVVLASGTGEQATPFEARLMAPPGCESGWQVVYLPWSDLTLASWVEDSGQTFDPARISGLEFSFGTGEEGLQNVIWVDDITLRTSAPEPEMVPNEAIEETTGQDEETQNGIGSLIGRICPASLALPLMITALALRRKKGDRFS